MQIISEPDLTAELIGRRHARLLERLRAAAQRAERDPGGFRIVAVTKTWPIEVCRAALEAGVAILGENRVQEAEPKVAALPQAEWHLVGRLQSNKVRRAVRAFATVHSVDSLELLERVERVSTQEGRQLRLLLEVNVSGEEGHAGFPSATLEDVARGPGEMIAAIRSARNAPVVGLMTMARFGASEAAARDTFRTLRRLRDALEQQWGVALPELSMGMTADAEAAVAEGATLVRIGTALFGPRRS